MTVTSEGFVSAVGPSVASIPHRPSFACSGVDLSCVCEFAQDIIFALI